MKCCICNKEIEVEPSGWAQGHNPQPVVTEPDARCCGDCNAIVVIPARMKKILEQK